MLLIKAEISEVGYGENEVIISKNVVVKGDCCILSAETGLRAHVKDLHEIGSIAKKFLPKICCNVNLVKR